MLVWTPPYAMPRHYYYYAMIITLHAAIVASATLLLLRLLLMAITLSRLLRYYATLFSLTRHIHAAAIFMPRYAVPRDFVTRRCFIDAAFRYAAIFL